MWLVVSRQGFLSADDLYLQSQLGVHVQHAGDWIDDEIEQSFEHPHDGIFDGGSDVEKRVSGTN